MILLRWQKNKDNQIAYTYFISFATTGVSSETRIQDVVVYITKYLNPTQKVYGKLFVSETVPKLLYRFFSPWRVNSSRVFVNLKMRLKVVQYMVCALIQGSGPEPGLHAVCVM